MIGVELREATPADEPAVAALLAASYPALMATAYDADALAAALPRMTRPNADLLASGRFYLAEVGGAIVGCGGWSAGRPGGGEIEAGLAHIRHFAVHPDYAGKGVGRAIFTRCETDAKASGGDRFECYSSLNGAAFYGALGFETIERFDVPMGPDVLFPSILMRRSIG